MLTEPSSQPSCKLVPASFAQARLWYLDQLDPGLADYNVAIGWRIDGPLDVAALHRALQVVVDRHEVLRTTLVAIDGQPWQRIEPRLAIEMPVTDIGAVAAPEREAEATRVLAAEVLRPFDLALGPLLRARVVRLDERHHGFVIALHHTVCGGNTGNILAHELGVAYAALLANATLSLDPAVQQHAEYSSWQQEQLTPARNAELVAFWRERLADAPPALTLPTARRRPLVRSSAGAWVPFRLEAELVRALEALALSAEVTLHMTLLAAFQVLLGRHAGQDDVLVGLPVSARPRGMFKDVMGFLVNTVVHRGDLGGDPTFRALLARTAASAREAYAHRDLPLERVIEATSPWRDPGRTPLFQAMFTLQEADKSPLDLAGAAVEPVRLRNTAAKVDLSALLYRDGTWIDGEFEYSTELFDAAAIEHMAAQYRHLLAEVARDPDRPLSRLPLLSPAEQQRMLAARNPRATEFPADTSIAALFAAQARRTPDAVAVVDGTSTLTYSALERRACALAARLQALGIDEGSRVGMCIERSTDEIVACLGILFAGCAYVPLDPSHPPERLAAMLDDAGADGVVTVRGAAHALDGANSARPVVMLDAESTESEGEMNLPPSASRGDDPACVMYTSGSTGAPKGVAVTHRGIARLVCATDYLQLRGGDTVAHLSNPAFDATAFELWGALLNGARVAIIARDVVMSPAMLADALDRNEATALLLTTALFDRVAQDAPHALRGRQVLFGGEAATPRCVRSALDEGHPARLVHLYGPTEATTIATWHEVRAVDHDAVTVPIGRPIANTTVHLLDAHGAPVPPGVAGEIFIGGPGVALGYVGQPALTAERFVADPFDATAGARLYRTGDLARDRGDGVLEFVGRRDRQVKLRGHRIELAEIETALVRLHGVRDAAVVMHGEASDTRRLAAYVVPVPDAVLAPEDLWRGLRRTLPEYMVPAGIVLLAALPLTRNGKVDHAALPDPDVMARQRNLLQASPSDPLEYAIFMIWRAHLGHANFGVCESFFDVGGHSLLAARMIDAIESACGVDVPLVTLFEAPTIEALAAAIRGTDRAQGAISSVVNPKGTRPPFFFLHGDFNGGGFYSRRLAQALGTDQPFYALHPHGIGGERIPDSIEAMADERLHALREVHPHGPYFLGGYCNGALVALEMARRLVAAQEEVPVVVVIDAAAPGMPTTSSRGLDSLDARYQGVMAGYAPPPYSGRIAVLHSDAMSDPRTREAWVPFARQVEFHPIPGDHFAAITTNAVATAGQMRACLQRALP